MRNWKKWKHLVKHETEFKTNTLESTHAKSKSNIDKAYENVAVISKIF